MMNRALAGQLPELLFTKNYKEFLHGNLSPGRPVRINYDAERLPVVFGRPDLGVDCHAVFRRGAAPRTQRLHSATGTLTRKPGDEPGRGSMVTTLLEIPEDAERLELWFTAGSAGNVAAYDSDYGKNFTFPFVERDVRVREAHVAAVEGSSLDNFGVTVECAAGITGVELDFRVTNIPPIAPRPTHVVMERSARLPDGWQTWTTPTIEVPHLAVVAFSITYRLGNKTYFDDNNHRGYFAPVAAHRSLNELIARVVDRVLKKYGGDRATLIAAATVLIPLVSLVVKGLKGDGRERLSVDQVVPTVRRGLGEGANAAGVYLDYLVENTIEELLT